MVELNRRSAATNLTAGGTGLCGWQDGSRKYVYSASRGVLLTRLQEKRWRMAAGIPLSTRGFRP